MGYIRWPSDSGSGGTKGVEFIRCIDGQEPQIHEIWRLSSDGVTCEVHLAAQIDVGTETVEQFTANYLAKNGRRIPVIGQISINRSVEPLSIPADAWGCGLPFIENVQAPTDTTGWGHGGTSNQNWGVTLGVSYSIVSVAWGSTIPARSAYIPRSSDNLCITARCVRDKFFRLRYCGLERRHYIIFNPIVNPRVNCHGDDRDSPVTQ